MSLKKSDFLDRIPGKEAGVRANLAATLDRRGALTSAATPGCKRWQTRQSDTTVSQLNTICGGTHRTGFEDGPRWQCRNRITGDTLVAADCKES